MVAQVFDCVVVTARDCLPKRSFGLCDVVQVQFGTSATRGREVRYSRMGGS